MESIKELKRICQSTVKKEEYWYMRYICRNISIYLTRLFIPTRITANQVTFLSIITALASGIFFAFGNRWAVLLGAALFQLWYLIDCVDGEIARYRRYEDERKITTNKITFNMTGFFFDSYAHYFLTPYLFVCIGLGQYLQSSHIVVLLLGSAAGISLPLISMITDCTYKTFITFILGTSGVTVNRSPKASPGRGVSFARRVLSLMHQTCLVNRVMNVVTAAAAIDIFLSGITVYGRTVNIMTLVVVYYAFAATFIWVSKLTYIVMKKKTDSEFYATFNVPESDTGRETSQCAGCAEGTSR